VNIGIFSSGSYPVSISHNDYFTLLDTILFTGDIIITLSLTQKTANVTFQISDRAGSLSGIKVSMTGYQYTNSSGIAFFYPVPARADYVYSLEGVDYQLVKDTFFLHTDTSLRIILEKAVPVIEKDSQETTLKPNPFDSYLSVNVPESS